MKTKIAALVVGAALLGGVACSSSNTSSTTTTAAAGGTSTTAKSSDTTAKTSDTKATSGKTTVTKPAKVEKVDKSKLPKQAQSSPKNLDVTQDESDCIDFVIYKVYTDDPSTPTDDATVSGIAGGAIAACVDQTKIAEGITTAIKSGGSNLTDDQLACIKKEIASADQQSLAIFLGVLITGDSELMKPFKDALSTACNITAS